jgi:transcription elongation factor GreB
MRRMDLAEIVDSSQQQHLEKVFFGAWVTLYNIDDETEHVYRIVGKDELAPSKGYISWISPLGKAMLGRTIGDTVHLTSPKGDETFEVIDISYKDPDLKP